MLLVVPLASPTAIADSCGSPSVHTVDRTTSTTRRTSDRTPSELLAFQSGRSPARFSVRWIGQDGHDYVGPGNQLRPSDTQDIQLELENLDPRREVVSVDVTGKGTDEWMYNAESGAWSAELKRTKGSPTAALFIEANRVETGRPFHVLVRYDDGSTVEADLRGGQADPNLRMPGAAVAARWIGQDGQDWTAKGPSVGPDGLQDVRIHLTRNLGQGAGQGDPHRGASRHVPEFGTNPKLDSNAELVRDPKDQSQGDLFFQPDRDLSDQHITLTVVYENERSRQDDCRRRPVRSRAPGAAATTARS